MKTLVLSDQHGPGAQSRPVKQSQTSTNQKRRWGKRDWERMDMIAARCFWVTVSIVMVVMFVGFFRVWAFGQDYHFRPRWYDIPARWVLIQIMSESPTIDPEKVLIMDID